MLYILSRVNHEGQKIYRGRRLHPYTPQIQLARRFTTKRAAEKEGAKQPALEWQIEGDKPMILFFGITRWDSSGQTWLTNKLIGKRDPVAKTSPKIKSAALFDNFREARQYREQYAPGKGWLIVSVSEFKQATTTPVPADEELARLTSDLKEEAESVQQFAEALHALSVGSPEGLQMLEAAESNYSLYGIASEMVSGGKTRRKIWQEINLRKGIEGEYNTLQGIIDTARNLAKETYNSLN